MSRVQRLPKGAYLLAKALAVVRDEKGNITFLTLWEGRWESQLILWPDEVRLFKRWLSEDHGDPVGMPLFDPVT